MEIQGKVKRLGNLTEGQSANGAWSKQELIIETIEQYPKQVCLLIWGDKIEALAALNEGDVIKAGISIESREFNGKWYTDVRAFSLGLVSSAPRQAVVEQPTPIPAPQPTYQQASMTDCFTNDDDLSF